MNPNHIPIGETKPTLRGRDGRGRPPARPARPLRVDDPVDGARALATSWMSGSRSPKRSCLASPDLPTWPTNCAIWSAGRTRCAVAWGRPTAAFAPAPTELLVEVLHGRLSALRPYLLIVSEAAAVRAAGALVGRGGGADMAGWFKLFDEVRHDSKLKRIASSIGVAPATARGLWLDLLCFAHELDQDWHLQLTAKAHLPLTEIADELGADQDAAEHFIHECVALGMLTQTRGGA